MLADDLGRYWAGEPIIARPVGRVERLVRWTHREPAVAVTSAIVGLLLVLVTILSITAYVTESDLRQQITAHATRLENGT